MSEFSFALEQDDYAIEPAGRLLLSYPVKTARDRILVRLQTELGEWFLDNGVGVPWYGDNGILGSKKQADEIGAIIRAQILDTDGVVRIQTFDLNFDTIRRNLNINSTVVNEGGTEQLVSVSL